MIAAVQLGSNTVVNFLEQPCNAMTDTMCPICRSDWASDGPDEAHTWLACGHKYHQACLCTYCEVTATDPESIRCPVCKLSWTDLQGAAAALDGADPGAADAADVAQNAADVPVAGLAENHAAGDADDVAAHALQGANLPDTQFFDWSAFESRGCCGACG